MFVIMWCIGSPGSDWDSDWFVRVPIMFQLICSDSDENFDWQKTSRTRIRHVNDTRRTKPKFEVGILLVLEIGIDIELELEIDIGIDIELEIEIEI